MINASADWNLWQREIASTQQVSLGVSDLSPPWHDYHVHPIGKVSINPLLDSSQNWIPPPWRPGDPGWIFPFWGGHLSLSTEQGENGPMRITHQWTWKSLSCVQLFATPWTIQSMELSRPEYCLSFLQGIFPTQGSNPGLLHCRWILYQLSQKGSPRILEWVAYPFSSGSFWPRNQTAVSCIAGGFFTNWAIREAQNTARKDIYGFIAFTTLYHTDKEDIVI